MMYSDLARQLQRLGRQQRNRIWFERIRHRLGPTAWYATTILVIAASVHQLLRPLNALAIIGMVIILVLLYLCWLVIQQKPTLQQAAAAADQRFSANSLFVSAWELTRSGADYQRVEALLLERCASTLPDWIRSPAPAAQNHLRPSTLITLTLAMLAVFFLLQASHVQPLDELPGTTDSQANQATTASLKALSTLLDKPTDWPVQNSAARADSSRSESFAATDASSHSAPGERTTGAAERPASTASERSLPKLPATGLADSRVGSSALDDDSASASGVSDAAAQAPGTDAIEATVYDQAQLIDIETGSAQGSAAGDVTNQGKPLLASTPEQETPTRSVSDPSRQLSANGTGYQLSPLQRRLVGRYLAQLGTIDETNE